MKTDPELNLKKLLQQEKELQHSKILSYILAKTYQINSS